MRVETAERDSFLIRQFQDFYQELLRLRGRVEEVGWWFSETEQTSDEAAPNAVWRTLYALFERQSLRARRAGADFAGDVYSQAQYVMAALADEIFLNLEWPGRDAWRSQLLEAKLFGSHNAGEAIFDRIDQLLADPVPVNAELARIYISALALGFQGKFRGLEDGDLDLFRYRQRLYEHLLRLEPGLEGDRRYLVPEAYASTLDRDTPQRLPFLKPWGLAVALVLLLWVLGSIVIWRDLVVDMRHQVDEILQLGAGDPGRGG